MHLRASPAAHVDASCALLARRRIDLRRKARERPHVVDEQAHCDGVLAGELACKTPGDTDVAVIVDGGAEDVPARGGCGPIGRAAGRGRGEISGGAGSFKKKKPKMREARSHI